MTPDDQKLIARALGMDERIPMDAPVIVGAVKNYQFLLGDAADRLQDLLATGAIPEEWQEATKEAINTYMGKRV